MLRPDPQQERIDQLQQQLAAQRERIAELETKVEELLEAVSDKTAFLYGKW